MIQKIKLNPLVAVMQEVMQKRGWKNADLAREANVSAAVISRIFNGSVNIKVDSLAKILEALAIYPIKTSPTKSPVVNMEQLSWEFKSLLESIQEQIDAFFLLASFLMRARG